MPVSHPSTHVQLHACAHGCRWLLQHASLGVAWLFNMSYSITLVFLAAWTVVKIAPQASGAGVAEVMAYLNGCLIPKVGLPAAKAFPVAICMTSYLKHAGTACQDAQMREKLGEMCRPRQCTHDFHWSSVLLLPLQLSHLHSRPPVCADRAWNALSQSSFFMSFHISKNLEEKAGLSSGMKAIARRPLRQLYCMICQLLPFSEVSCAYQPLLQALNPYTV